jgi:hypothetical protein
MREMTDNEIKKALECYRNSKIIQAENGVISIGDIIDIINRQQAEIERLKYFLENDVIVLPFKVGDTVYDTAYNKITELIIYGIEFAQTATDTRLRLIAAENGRHHTMCGNISNIIKTVFLTKEEAEQALKGGAE